MVNPRRAQRPSKETRFTVLDFRAIGFTTVDIKDGDVTIAWEVPREAAAALVELLNLADAVAKGWPIRQAVPNSEFVASIVARAMGGSVDFTSFAEGRRG